VVQRICRDDAKHPFIITNQDIGPFTKALLDAKPGKTAMLSWVEMAQLSRKAIDQIAKFRELGLEELREQFPVKGEELLSAKYSAEFGHAGGEPNDLGFQNRPEEINPGCACRTGVPFSTPSQMRSPRINQPFYFVICKPSHQAPQHLTRVISPSQNLPPLPSTASAASGWS